jgi:hypothetical protein
MELKYELVAKTYCEGEGFHRSTIQMGDLLRDSTGRVFMVESDAFVHEYYQSNVWDADLWRWQGDFPEAPWQSE